MDTATQRTKLESDLREIEAFEKSPLWKGLIEDNAEQQESLINLLCNNTIVNIETFFAHFEAMGHLRGLRRMPGLLRDRKDAIAEELKNLE